MSAPKIQLSAQKEEAKAQLEKVEEDICQAVETNQSDEDDSPTTVQKIEDDQEQNVIRADSIAPFLEEDLKKLCIIGGTGCGKSSSCISISKANTKFYCSAHSKSVTYKTNCQIVNWFGDQNEEKFVLIDTPGLGDSEGRDTQHISEMVAKLKRLKSINAFIIVFNGQQPRFDENVQSMLTIFKNIFGEKFLFNTAFLFTRWGMSRKDIRSRLILGESEEKKSQEFNEHIKCKLGFDSDIKIPCFFIDNTLNEDLIFEDSDENEQKAYKKVLQEIKEFTNTNVSFECLDIKEVQRQMEKDRQEKEELERQCKEQQLKMEELEKEREIEKQRVEQEMKEQQEQLKLKEEELEKLKMAEQEKIEQQKQFEVMQKELEKCQIQIKEQNEKITNQQPQIVYVPTPLDPSIAQTYGNLLYPQIQQSILAQGSNLNSSFHYSHPSLSNFDKEMKSALEQRLKVTEDLSAANVNDPFPAFDPPKSPQPKATPQSIQQFQLYKEQLSGYKQYIDKFQLSTESSLKYTREGDYEGQINQFTGEKEGIGIRHYSSYDAYYVGNFKAGQLVGAGVWICKLGVYDGNFKVQFSGKGRYIRNKDQLCITGNWDKDCIQGKVVIQKRHENETMEKYFSYPIKYSTLAEMSISEIEQASSPQTLSQFKKYSNLLSYKKYIDNFSLSSSSQLGYKNEANYEGQYNINTDEKEGLGIQKWHDGSTYVGYFKSNHFQGDGVWICNDGIYIGNFEKTMFNGYGTFIRNDNLSVVGSWKNDAISGEVMITSSSGSIVSTGYLTYSVKYTTLGQYSEYELKSLIAPQKKVQYGCPAFETSNLTPHCYQCGTEMTRKKNSSYNKKCKLCRKLLGDKYYKCDYCEIRVCLRDSASLEQYGSNKSKKSGSSQLNMSVYSIASTGSKNKRCRRCNAVYKASKGHCCAY